MEYVKLGKTKLFINKDATKENKQPHFKGYLTIEHNIPAGAEIGLAGWLNESETDQTDKALFFQVSAKDEELDKSLKSENDNPF